MKPVALILLSLFLAATPAPAQTEGCPNPCPEGQIYSAEEGRCIIMTPMV